MGYRQHSFDPNAYEQQGKPLRPFNWVQWSGVAAAIVGLAIDAVYFAGKLGWSKAPLDSPSLAMPFILLGVVLVNSRSGRPCCS